MKKISGILPLFAVALGLILCSFAESQPSSFGGTTFYFANENNDPGMPQMGNTVPSDWPEVTASVALAGGPVNYCETHCASPTSIVCFVGVTLAGDPGSFVITSIFDGTWVDPNR